MLIDFFYQVCCYKALLVVFDESWCMCVPDAMKSQRRSTRGDMHQQSNEQRRFSSRERVRVCVRVEQ